MKLRIPILISVLTLTPFLVFAQGIPFSVEKLSDAGESRDFVVGPGKVEIVLNPGEERTVDLKVSNRMGVERTFLIEIEDFIGSQDPAQTVVLLGDVRGPYSLKDYLKVPAFEFTLEHGERATVPVTISIPADEEPGGRYGSVIISTVTEKGEKLSSASAAVISRIGTLFFVRVSGEAEESGILRSFRTKNGKKFFSKSPMEFEILYENSGSVHLNPYGEVRIKNILGKEVGAVFIDPWFTMPDSLRLREISWEKNPLFGFYTAEASINRGYQNIIDHDQFSFLVLPWKLILVSLALIFIFILILRFIFKRFEFRRKKTELN
ncbi:MAG: hypothetical protein G01um1014107_250 [Parcubacteria group bacterium Gr01-1014_107]|nr:MAG: hypothetical protein G01um1014107_250 [Parcubacteria group bacterium Gr01-1014_107]